MRISKWEEAGSQYLDSVKDSKGQRNSSELKDLRSDSKQDVSNMWYIESIILIYQKFTPQTDLRCWEQPRKSDES